MNEKMTLTERLRNPQWVALPEADRIMLDIEYTTKTMIEAAARIEELENEPAVNAEYERKCAEFLKKQGAQ